MIKTCLWLPYTYNLIMYLTTYKHAAYTSFVHLASALVRSIDAFSTDMEFVQLYL